MEIKSIKEENSIQMISEFKTSVFMFIHKGKIRLIRTFQMQIERALCDTV